MKKKIVVTVVIVVMLLLFGGYLILDDIFPKAEPIVQIEVGMKGRNRQIRKMCEQVGLTVKRLARVSIGKLKLNNLPVGKWRYLEEEEVEYLRRATRGAKNV